MRGSHLCRFDRLQSRSKSAFDKNDDLPEATRAALLNYNREDSEVGDFLGGASKAIEFLWLPTFRHGTPFASARHPKPVSLITSNNLFFRGFHLISRRPQELYPSAMPQVESYTQRTMRHYAILSLSHTDKLIYNPRYLFHTSSPQYLAKTPPSALPAGGLLEPSSDGEAH